MITAADIQTIRNNDPGAVLPGIDTMTGNPYATSSLLDVTKITQNSSAPYHYIPSKNEVVVTQAGAVLSGINFGDATVLINANNVTIKNVRCEQMQDASGWGLYIGRTGAANLQNLKVENFMFAIGQNGATVQNTLNAPKRHPP